MEEKEVKKTVKMEIAQNNTGGQQAKLSYEELNDACAQLSQQNQYLVRQMRQMDMTNMFRRLDYLFKVLENAHVIKDTDFINSCVSEIKEAMTIDTSKDDKNEEV